MSADEQVPSHRFRLWAFWVLAILWLPAGIVAQASVRFSGSETLWLTGFLQSGGIAVLAMAAPCGLPLALGCHRLWLSGYRVSAAVAWVVFGGVTLWASVLAGLLGPPAIAIAATILSLPVWAAAWAAKAWAARKTRQGK